MSTSSGFAECAHKQMFGDSADTEAEPGSAASLLVTLGSALMPPKLESLICRMEVTDSIPETAV